MKCCNWLCINHRDNDTCSGETVELYDYVKNCELRESAERELRNQESSEQIGIDRAFRNGDSVL